MFSWRSLTSRRSRRAGRWRRRRTTASPATPSVRRQQLRPRTAVNGSARAGPGTGGLGQDAAEVVRVSADSSTRIGKRPCSSGIRSLGLARWNAPEAMNRMWSVRTDAVLGADHRALDQRQQVALHALAADVGAVAFGALGDLVDLVDEDDAVLLAGLDRLLADLVLVDQLAGLLLDQLRPARRGSSACASATSPPPSWLNIWRSCWPISSMPGGVMMSTPTLSCVRSRSRARRARLRAAACAASARVSDSLPPSARSAAGRVAPRRGSSASRMRSSARSSAWLRTAPWPARGAA
jgi:hypothetical protein